MIKDPGNVMEDERCFRTVIEIARRQSARLLALRATVSLARLLKKRSETGEAHQILGDINGWFIEGFDTGDLKEAKALLETLDSYRS